MDGRLALGIQQTLFDAVVSGVIRKQDLAVAFPAPGQFSLLVVVGTADQVVPVVVGIADGAVAGGQHHGLAAFIQVFSQNDTLPVIPGIALGGVAQGAGNRGIIQIQERFGQYQAVFIHRAEHGGITFAHVGALIVFVQVVQADDVLVVVVSILQGGIAVLAQGRPAGGVHKRLAPDFALIAVFIPDARIAAGDNHGQILGIQIGFADHAVGVVIIVLDRSVAHRCFHRLKGCA